MNHFTIIYNIISSVHMSDGWITIVTALVYTNDCGNNNMIVISVTFDILVTI